MTYLGEAMHYKPKCREFESRCGYWEYSLTNYFRQHCGSGIDTAYNTRECPGCHLGVKTTACKADIFTTLMCQLFGKSGILNLLEPSGSVQACNGIANVIPKPEKF